MFNSKKIKELESRIDVLEEQLRDIVWVSDKKRWGSRDNENLYSVKEIDDTFFSQTLNTLFVSQKPNYTSKVWQGLGSSYKDSFGDTVKKPRPLI